MIVVSPTIPNIPIREEIASGLIFTLENPFPGVTYTWSAIDMPDGLTISSDGELEGTPTEGGSFTATIIATGSNGNEHTIEVTIRVAYITAPTIPYIVQDAEIPSGLIFVVENSPPGVTYTFTSFNLTPGLTIDSSTGELSGTPTGDGTRSVSITATGSDGNTYSTSVSIHVNPPVTVLIPTGLRLTVGFEERFGNFIDVSPSRRRFGVTYTFTVTGLPPGINVASDGRITGTPTEAGSFDITVTVTDSDGNTYTGDGTYVVHPAPSFTAPTIPNLNVGDPVPAGIIFSVENPRVSTYTYSAIDLPPNVTIDSSTGELEGIPRRAGTYRATIRARESRRTYSVVVTITVYN